MKATELRIGNRIISLGIDYDSGGNKNLDPEGDEEIVIDIETLALVEKDPTGYAPIPLTEEWLLRMGFRSTVVAHYVAWAFLNDTFYSYDADGEFRWFSKTLPSIDKIKHRARNGSNCAGDAAGTGVRLLWRRQSLPALPRKAFQRKVEPSNQQEKNYMGR